MRYSEYIQSYTIFKNNYSDGLIKINSPVVGDSFNFVLQFENNDYFIISFVLKKIITSVNYISFEILDNKIYFRNSLQDDVFSMRVGVPTSFSKSLDILPFLTDIEDVGDMVWGTPVSTINDFYNSVNVFCKTNKLNLNQYNLTLPSYFDVYENATEYYGFNTKVYSNFDFMMSMLNYNNFGLQQLTNTILSDLSAKITTLDNLNILASADFSPLLNLSTFADLIGTLNPILTNQVNALNTLNSYANTLQPVRAKYGQPVPPLSPATVKLSLINSHNLEITRLDKSKNSICYLTDKKNNLISYFYDIDYSKTIDLSKYSELWLTYSTSDYSISLQPLIGFDDK